MEKNKHFFYVLKCVDDTLYAGYTNDLEARISTHNSGKGAKYTRGRLPVECIHFEVFESKRIAMQKEYEFKQWSRKKKNQYIKEMNCRAR